MIKFINEKTFRDFGSGFVMQKILIYIGLIIIVIGILWPFLKEIPIGRLPGDIVYRKGNFNFYFPIVTYLVVSLIVTIIFKFFK
mgnify:FL=1